jgi:hypothetical protein
MACLYVSGTIGLSEMKRVIGGHIELFRVCYGGDLSSMSSHTCATRPCLSRSIKVWDMMIPGCPDKAQLLGYVCLIRDFFLNVCVGGVNLLLKIVEGGIAVAEGSLSTSYTFSRSGTSASTSTWSTGFSCMCVSCLM